MFITPVSPQAAIVGVRYATRHVATKTPTLSATPPDEPKPVQAEVKSVRKKPSDVTLMIQDMWHVYDQARADGRKTDTELAAKGLLNIMYPDFRRLVRRTGSTGADEEDFHSECRHALAMSMMLYDEGSAGRNFRTDVIWRARTYMRRYINKRTAYRQVVKLDSEFGIYSVNTSEGRYLDPKTDEIAAACDEGFDEVEAGILYQRSIQILGASEECNDRDIEIFDRYYRGDASMYQIGNDMNLNPQIVTRAITRCMKIIQRRLWDAKDSSRN